MYFRGGRRRRRFAAARLAQPAERKAINLVVVGSSRTVGVFGVWVLRFGRGVANAIPGRLEFSTLRLTTSRSNQLSDGVSKLEAVCVDAKEKRRAGGQGVQ